MYKYDISLIGPECGHTYSLWHKKKFSKQQILCMVAEGFVYVKKLAQRTDWKNSNNWELNWKDELPYHWDIVDMALPYVIKYLIEIRKFVPPKKEVLEREILISDTADLFNDDQCTTDLSQDTINLKIEIQKLLKEVIND